MAQQKFTATPGTHQDVRDVINSNSDDAELRLSSLETSGVSGESAYEIAVNNGFAGSEADWLESLIGADGVAGNDGADGTQGLTGPAGEDGTSVVLKGTVADFSSLPAGAAEGDLYITLDTGDGWVSDGTEGWGNVGAIRGPEGPKGEKGDIGLTGDDGLTGNVGQQGIQGEQGEVGESGENGNTILNGDFIPTIEGVDGDFFIRTDTLELYGPKTAVGWGEEPTSLVGLTGLDGSDGNTILSSFSPPLNSEGVDGDFFLNIETSDFYGPKTSGVWGPAVSLLGQDGAGVPTGGTANQIISKLDGVDFNTTWVDNTANNTAYDNVDSGLNAINVKDAIDEIAAATVKFWYLNKMGDELTAFSGDGEKTAWIAPAAGKIHSVHSGASTVTQGGNIVIDVKKQGLSILSTLGVIASGSDNTTSGTPHVLTANPTSFAAGDRISFEISSFTALGGAKGLHTDILISWD
jgi:hypothetical protein